MSQSPPHTSETISLFLTMMEDSKKDYEWCLKEKLKMEQLTQDYLHDLELLNLNYKERAKVATKLAECRKRRREYKDVTEALSPLVDFLNSDKGNQLMKLMNEVLGKTRKAESKLENRVYFHRVLEGTINNA